MRPNGITIIETVVVLSILSIASIVIGSIYISHSKLYYSENAAAVLKLQKSIFTKNIENAGAGAAGISSAYIFGGIPRASTSSTAIFKLPAIDANENIITGKFDYEAFYREGNKIFAEVASDAASARKNLKRQLADTAQNLIFQYNAPLPQDASVITPILYLQSGSKSEKIQTSIYLRNK